MQVVIGTVTAVQNKFVIVAPLFLELTRLDKELPESSKYRAMLPKDFPLEYSNALAA